MIALALALLAVQIPPSPSGRVLPPGAVEILDPIAPMVARYEACLAQKFGAAHPIGVRDADAHRLAVNQVIPQCAEVRRTAVAEAERALARAPDYQNRARRDAAIRHAFEGTEHVRRELVAMVRDGVLPGTERAAAPAPNVQVPRRVMPAAMRYMRCMTDGMNAVLALDGRDPREAKAALLDAECRVAGRDALPKVTIGTVTSVNPAEVTALEKAMDEMRASIIKTFLGPFETPRAASGNKSHDGALRKEIIR
jgi:hypothetical protein